MVWLREDGVVEKGEGGRVFKDFFFSVGFVEPNGEGVLEEKRMEGIIAPQ